MKQKRTKSTIIQSFFVVLQVRAFRIMNSNTNELTTPAAYMAPSLRIIATNMETSFMASNLEPIDGGDDPDIDW